MDDIIDLFNKKISSRRFKQWRTMIKIVEQDGSYELFPVCPCNSHPDTNYYANADIIKAYIDSKDFFFEIRDLIHNARQKCTAYCFWEDISDWRDKKHGRL